jgi:Raf kinase inhibitor-like YbhB/YbcL family protein
MRRVGLILISLLVVAVAIAGCTKPAAPPENVPPEGTTVPKSEASPLPKGEEAAFSITSPLFQAGEKIPVKYTCDGQNISPPLDWSQGSAGTNSFALIMDDPDSPGGAFTHWVIFNLPPDTRGLPEAVPAEGELSNGALQGKNNSGKIGYFGPCPPSGSAHHYRFTVYALDRPLDLAAGASKVQVLQAMQGHILAQGQLVGTYQR